MNDIVAHRGDSVVWMTIREQRNGDCGNPYIGDKRRCYMSSQGITWREERISGKTVRNVEDRDALGNR